MPSTLINFLAGNYILPPVKACTLQHLQDIFVGHKRVLISTEANDKFVPFVPELALKNQYWKITEDLPRVK